MTYPQRVSYSVVGQHEPRLSDDMTSHASAPLTPLPYALAPPSQHVATSRQDDIEYEGDVEKNIIPSAPVSGIQYQPENHPPENIMTLNTKAMWRKNLLPRAPVSGMQYQPEYHPPQENGPVASAEPGLECSWMEEPGLRKSWLEFEEFFEDCEEDCCINTCLACFMIFHPVTLAILSTIGMFIFLTPGSSEEMPGSRVLNVCLLLMSMVGPLGVGYGMIYKRRWFLAPHLLFHTGFGYVAIYWMYLGVPFQFFLFIMLDFIHIYLIIMWNKDYILKSGIAFKCFMILVIVLAGLGIIFSIIVDGRLAAVRHKQRYGG
ncbi:unnamed protein product [Meganyctiphanes norvegica]|uniref:Uncharacterized protein n=1 Tax=Meganyctiphanes norvegica TaxID=48144 RepID=A0AAV2RWW9_MEGNR